MKPLKMINFASGVPGVPQDLIITPRLLREVAQEMSELADALEGGNGPDAQDDNTI